MRCRVNLDQNSVVRSTRHWPLLRSEGYDVRKGAGAFSFVLQNQSYLRPETHTTLVVYLKPVDYSTLHSFELDESHGQRLIKGFSGSVPVYDRVAVNIPWLL